MTKINENKEISRILISAKILMNVGWCQNSLVKYDHKNQKYNYCPTEAISKLSKLLTRFHHDEVENIYEFVKWNFKIYEILCSAISKHSCKDRLDAEIEIIEFNDHPDTTKEMILELFDRAIQIALYKEHMGEEEVPF